MRRCEFDHDEPPTLLAVPAVPRPSLVPRDIADYAHAFTELEDLARAAAHAHATRYATPPPPAPLPSQTAHPAGPRDDAMRRLAITVNTRRRPHAPPSPWTSVALLSLVGAVACLSAMAAFIQFKDGHGPTVTSTVGTPVAPSRPSTNR